MNNDGIIHTSWLSLRCKNEILPLAMTWMELEEFMLSDISQKEKGCSYSHVIDTETK